MTGQDSEPKPHSNRRRNGAAALAVSLVVGGAAAGYLATNSSDRPRPSASAEATPKTDAEILASMNGQSVPNVIKSFNGGTVVYNKADPATRKAIKLPAAKAGFDVYTGAETTVSDHTVLGFGFNGGEVWVDEGLTPPAAVTPNDGPKTVELKVGQNGHISAVNAHAGPVNTYTATIAPSVQS